jgi:hypothetical protein
MTADECVSQGGCCDVPPGDYFRRLMLSRKVYWDPSNEFGLRRGKLLPLTFGIKSVERELKITNTPVFDLANSSQKIDKSGHARCP